MDARGKRLLIIAGIVVILFLGITAYFIFFKKSPASNDASGVNPNLFPFDQQVAKINSLPLLDTTTPNLETNNPTAPVPVNTRARLRKITTFPISGFISYLTTEYIPKTTTDPKTGKSSTVMDPIITHRIRYNDQRVGNIFEGIVTEDSIINRKVTKTTLPSAEELVFNPTGSTGLLRYERDGGIASFRITIPEPQKVPEYCTINFTTDLKIGSKGVEVKKLQTYLNGKLAQTAKIDSVYSKTTANWVSNLQKILVVGDTGIFNAETRAAIIADCDKIRSEIEQEKNEPIELKGSLVDGYITQTAKNNSLSNLFILKTFGQRMTGFIQSFDGSNNQQIFSSSYNEWMPQYVNKDLITMTTYASGNTTGYMYTLNPTTKSLSRVMGPLQGLTTLTSPTGNYVLLTNIENKKIVTKIVNIKTQTTQILPFVTLPEKCSWYSNDLLYCGVPNAITAGTYPDDWYKGVVGFSDNLWSYTVSTSRAVLVEQPDVPLNIFRMDSFVQPGYLFFMNKTTYELWSYRISGDN
jgi:hypothetical protein